MDMQFRLEFAKQIADIESKETYHPDQSSGRKIVKDGETSNYFAEGIFYFRDKGRTELVTYVLQTTSAKNLTEWMMKPLETNNDLVGLIARKVLSPDYKGYFAVSAPGTMIRPVDQLVDLKSVNGYPPGYQGMLNSSLNTENGYMNEYLQGRGAINGCEYIAKKIDATVESILKIARGLHAKPCDKDQMFFSGSLVDDSSTYIRPRVEEKNASLSWVIKFGDAVPASDLAPCSKVIREAKKALAYYKRHEDAEYQSVVITSLKDLIAKGVDPSKEDPFVRPVLSIELSGLAPQSKTDMTLDNSILLEKDWTILEKIFERANEAWIKSEVTK